MRTGKLKSKVLRAAQLIVGDARTERLRLRRNFRHYERRGLIFVHTPKCAGTSVSNALYGTSLGHYSAAELRRFDGEAFARLDSFATVRDPIERAWSAYRFAASGGSRQGWAAHRLEYESADFRTFESFATKWLPGRSDEELDYVFRRQSLFVRDEGEIIVKRLVKVESLPSLWDEIVDGKPVKHRELRRLNVSHPLREPVSAAAEAALREYYADDFRLLELAD